MIYHVFVHENNEGSRTKNTAQLEQILCGLHKQDIQRREHIFVSVFFMTINTKGSGGNKYCMLLYGYIPF